MKSIVFCFFMISTLFFHTNNPPKENVIVLELFTSQGCSSCPPADKLLDEVKSDNIIALSYHVDYWNYIGWKDPFSKADFTEKQRDYALKFSNSTLYTPQMVINGKEHFVGSNSSILQSKIEAYKNTKITSRQIHLQDVNRTDNYVSFDYKITGKSSGAYIKAILVIDEYVTQVKRGENRNRTLTNSNIVINEKLIADNNSITSNVIEIPEKFKEVKNLSLVLISQNKNLDISTGIIKSVN